MILCVFALAGCSSRQVPLQSTGQLSVVEGSNTLPAPRSADLSAAARPTVIGPLDKLDVVVFNIPELTRELVQVDAAGNIAVPLIGNVVAAGKSTAELGAEIAAGLRRNYVRDPQVAINMRETVSQVVAVEGQVTQPGLYPVTNQTTLLRTVAAARGLTEFARLDDVVILRTVDGQRMAGLYNMTAIRRGLYADPAVYANDVVVVGDSPQRRMFRDFVQVAPLLASPIVALLQGI